MAVISAPISSTSIMRGRGGWRDLDWFMLLLVMALSLWGCLTILSATRPTDSAMSAQPVAGATTTVDKRGTGSKATGSARAGNKARSPMRGIPDGMKQAIWIVIGLTLLALVALSDYQWLMHLQFWIYISYLGLLAAVLVLPSHFAPIINGAKSWIHFGPFVLQPAEFGKFAVLVTLAAFLCRRQERIREFSTVVWSFLYLTPAILLILKQPDFGTTLAILSIWFGMLFFGGARLRHLALVLLAGATLFGLAWKTGKLKQHQKERLAVFLNTDTDSRGAAYQVNQSQIAIGSGQITGQGWGKGMQNRAGYVPEKSTDFIFAVVAEELGFVGAATLILAYLFLLFRSATIAMTNENYFGALIAGGFTTLLAFHTIINLGMTMRVMPITGVPLPFFSYGGSSYVAFSLSIGLLQSIATRRWRN
ncbi:MAG: rod shape-determining protein RodA [Armatimonadota bacterium]|nr:rod shape-determining protein RodA [Armatimonadota bacterium]